MMKQSAVMRKSAFKSTVFGNNRRARTYFKKMQQIDANTVCLAYISMDISRYHLLYGNEKGKKLQQRVEVQLTAFCGEFDYAGRFGDIDFIVGITCQNGFVAQQKINGLVDSLNQREAEFVGDSTSLFHAGLCFASDDAKDFDILFNNAVLAYNHACDNQMSICICTQELLKSETYRGYMREKLLNAIDNKQFEMFLQFIYNKEKGKFTCAEVLSRWNNPVEGFLMPTYYINDMRTTGVIKKFDMYMLDKTCALLEKWSNGPFEDLQLSCNITRITISSPDFANDFLKIIKKYKFNHLHLMLEITEDTLIDKEIAYKNIVVCKNEGVRIAIDDLCSGHSTLEDISDYPIDQVKLDRNVIVNTSSKRGNTLLKELISMAHNLNLEVVCEGVETEEQLNAVINNGCDFIQGYYYSYVLPVSEAKEYYIKSVS